MSSGKGGSTGLTTVFLLHIEPLQGRRRSSAAGRLCEFCQRNRRAADAEILPVLSRQRSTAMSTCALPGNFSCMASPRFERIDNVDGPFKGNSPELKEITMKAETGLSDKTPRNKAKIGCQKSIFETQSHLCHPVKTPALSLEIIGPGQQVLWGKFPSTPTGRSPTIGLDSSKRIKDSPAEKSKSSPAITVKPIGKAGDASETRPNRAISA